MYVRTLVSAYLNVNSKNRSAAEYLEFAQSLLKADCPKLIFIDEQLANQFASKFASKNLKLIVINKKHFYLLEEYKNNPECFNNFYKVNGNAKKDTLEFISIMCNKTEFMKQAIEMNPFETEGFVWVDFGMKHACPEISPEHYPSLLESLARKPMRQEEQKAVRIGHIWDLDMPSPSNVLHDIQWYFAGGVFGGTAAPLLEFANRTREKCLAIIDEHRLLPWEVNVWYLVSLEERELFSVYPCVHNSLLITNY